MVSCCQCCISQHITGKEVNFPLSIRILYITQGWLKRSFSTTQQTFWVMLLVCVITRCIDNCGIFSRYRTSNLFRTSYCLFPLSLTRTHQSSRPKHLQNNRRFLKMLPKLERLLQIKVPQLQLAIPATEETSPITVYNQDTYMEYHLSLSNLLKKFRLALEVLYELEDPHKKAFKDTWMTSCKWEMLYKRWLGAV